MSPEHPAPASHRAMTISVIVAAVALTVFALVATALMLGWIHPMAGGITPASFASPAQQVTGTAPDTGLAPGESVVAPSPAPSSPPASLPPTPRQPAPSTPVYARPKTKS